VTKPTIAQFEHVYMDGIADGEELERAKIVTWLRGLDQGGDGMMRELPITLANWIEEGMHNS